MHSAGTVLKAMRATADAACVRELAAERAGSWDPTIAFHKSFITRNRCIARFCDGSNSAELSR